MTFGHEKLTPTMKTPGVFLIGVGIGVGIESDPDSDPEIDQVTVETTRTVTCRSAGPQHSLICYRLIAPVKEEIAPCERVSQAGKCQLRS